MEGGEDIGKPLGKEEDFLEEVGLELSLQGGVCCGEATARAVAQGHREPSPTWSPEKRASGRCRANGPAGGTHREGWERQAETCGPKAAGEGGGNPTEGPEVKVRV